METRPASHHRGVARTALLFAVHAVSAQYVMKTSHDTMPTRPGIMSRRNRASCAFARRHCCNDHNVAMLLKSVFEKPSLDGVE
jgi:hypothetical protein